MKIDKLNAKAVAADEASSGPMALTEDQLREASAGIEPFSCAWYGGGTINYHDGYPRHY